MINIHLMTINKIIKKLVLIIVIIVICGFNSYANLIWVESSKEKENLLFNEYGKPLKIGNLVQLIRSENSEIDKPDALGNLMGSDEVIAVKYIGGLPDGKFGNGEIRFTAVDKRQIKYYVIRIWNGPTVQSSTKYGTSVPYKNHGGFNPLFIRPKELAAITDKPKE